MQGHNNQMPPRGGGMPPPQGMPPPGMPPQGPPMRQAGPPMGMVSGRELLVYFSRCEVSKSI